MMTTRDEKVRQRGSVLAVVLVTLVFASTALLLFVQKASTDLLVEVRAADAQRLRMEAYGAMETTLAVLEEFRRAGEGLRSPREGWGEPLAWTDYRPGEGRTVTVALQDESGRLSLPRVNFDTLRELFMQWEVLDAEAELWADALLGWMREDYTPRGVRAPEAADYARAPLGFKAPGRPLRSWGELAAIDVIREAWFDERGVPNVYVRRFREAVSLLDYAQPNLNAAPSGVLAARLGYDEYQLRQLGDYRAGTGAYAVGSRGFFETAAEVRGVLGEQISTEGFGTEVRALRVTVTVREGQGVFVLSAVMAPPGGARAVAAPVVPEVEGVAVRAAGAPQGGAVTGETKTGGTAVNYPFTLLEITENDVDSTAPATELSLL